jgi:hypothetical protein
MDRLDFLLAAGFLVGILLLAIAALAPGEARPRAAPPSRRAATRWRRFRVRPGALYRDERGAVWAAEDSGEAVLAVLAGSVERLPLRLGSDGHAARVRIDRARFSLRPFLRVKLDGAPWLGLRLEESGGFPALLPAAGDLPEGAPAAGEIQLVGDLAAREYEVRLAGRLAASATWLRGAEESAVETGAETAYAVEITQDAPLIPILALVAALEVAAALAGDAVDLESEETRA